MLNAVIYARYSSHSQREESIEGQLRECHDFAKKNNLRVIDEYCDRALSGKTDNRAAFQKLIRDAEKGQFHAVIMYTLDRFARSRYDSAMYKAKLKKYGVKVYYAKQAIPDTPEGIILESVLEGYAEYYSENLSRNIKRGMMENALQCKYNGSTIPLGYTITPDKKYEIDPVGAMIVREIFQMYADGQSTTEIVAYCNAKNYKTSLGKPFSKNSLSKLIRNDNYIGTYHFGDIHVPDGIPAILDKDLFEKVQSTLKRNYTSRARNKAKVDYLLSSKLVCGKCGANMLGESGTARNGNTHHYYKCAARKHYKMCDKNTEKKDWIEEQVVRITVQRVLTDETIDAIAEKAVELCNKEAADLTMLHYYEQEEKDTDARINKMMDAIETGVSTPRMIERMAELENYLQDVRDNIEYEKRKRPSLTKERIIFWLESFKDGDINDIEYRRRVIDTLVNKVYVYDTDDGGRRFVVTFNTTAENTAEITLSDVSDIVRSSPPQYANPNHLVFISHLVFAMIVEIESVA